MTISEAQRIERRLYIGSSDVAAICGVDEYKSAADVWYSKVFSGDEWGGNHYTEAGNYIEEGLIRYAEGQLGVPEGTAVRNAQFKKEISGVPFISNLDGYLADSGMVIEAKSTGNTHEWGTNGSDQIPDKVIFQVHQQMLTSGARTAVVPACFGYRGLRLGMYRLDWSQEVADFIVETCARFWHQNVVTKQRPDGPAPRLDTLRLLNREPEETVELPQDLVDQWHEARKQASDWRKEKERLDKEILSAMETVDPDGRVTLAEIGLAEGGYIDYSRSAKGRRSMKWKAEPWQKDETGS